MNRVNTGQMLRTGSVWNKHTLNVTYYYTGSETIALGYLPLLSNGLGIGASGGET